MFAGLLLGGITLGLFLAWFRYMCLVILRTRTFRDYAAEVAAMNDLRFVRVREELRHAAGHERMPAQYATLVEECRLLYYLLRHAATYEVPQQGTEMRMLRINFTLLRLGHLLLRPVAPRLARAMLAEMAEVVYYVANTMGESSRREITDTGNIPVASL